MLFSKSPKEDIAQPKSVPMESPEDYALRGDGIRKEPDFAPLFVKVEKYKESINLLHEMRLYTNGIKAIFSLLNEIDAVRLDALKMMKVTIQRLEKDVIEMDTELLRPKGLDFAPSNMGELEVRHIEDSLADLQKQISSLKTELKQV